jgi:hypothetical protein
LIVVAAMIVVGQPCVAQASWQWTSWGMSPQAVIALAAKRGVTVAAPPTLTPPDFEFPYDAVGVRFTAQLHFDKAHNLAKVTLISRDGLQCEKLRHLMSLLYGAPNNHWSRAAGLETFAWSDMRNSNYVEFEAIGGSGVDQKRCTITYDPLPNPKDSGL